MEVPPALAAMLAGEQGETRQKAARLVIDLADSAGASSFIEVDYAHVSGVSVITGGHGLRRFLADLAGDESGVVVIPTTLNSAGCDKEKIAEMGIEWADFLEQQFEIIEAYERLGIEATLSCTPYDRGIELAAGIASWAESNAVCYANSWSSLMTNRESGLSALATALTGYAPLWGLHIEENRRPNIRVTVTCEMSDLTDWSILGDWIGKQVLPEWELPWGVMPLISGLPDHASFAQRKALTSAAANYGCPMLWVEGISSTPTLEAEHKWQGELGFTQSDLESRYVDLAPQGKVDLVVIGCPQAGLEEIRHTAAAVRTHIELGHRIPDQRLWLFTSGHNYDLAQADGSISILEEAGTLVLRDTCPEVTPYNRQLYNHLLTNSLKAEHYLTSGLNRMPTSVAGIESCVAHAFDANLASGERPSLASSASSPAQKSSKTIQRGAAKLIGRSLPSQDEWSITGRAMVSDIPITYLGYVNRDTGVVEEPGHPLDGQAIEDTILIYPKGSGSTVAPYVLMGLIYTGKGPKAIVNREVCPLTLPAASLLGLPYGHGFDEDPCKAINDGDLVEIHLKDGKVVLKVVARVGDA
jgi:predicted aconitase/predicted aconitase with swiveling domain